MIERCYVINLKRRSDRLRAFWSMWQRCDWPADWPRPEVYPAIEGDVVGVPDEFTQGGGAYGCRMSHLRILQDCLMNGIGSVFVLEDDADLQPGLGPALVKLMEEVPDDWEGIMPGGQHHRPPEDVEGHPGIVRVRFAQRTHAYIARGNYLQGLQRRWGNGTVHIDWQMHGFQPRYHVYAPRRWLIGQAGGRSDIRGDKKPPEWWNEPEGNEPIVVLRASREVVESLRDRGLHAGFCRDPKTGYDVELPKCLAPTSANAKRSRLADWLRTIQRECSGSMICTVWHPDAAVADVEAAWDGPVLEIRASTAEEALSQLPAAWRSRLEASAAVNQPPTVLLQSSRSVMEAMRERGFHTGWWRDDETGCDRGLERILAKTPANRLVAELSSWHRVLEDEAKRDGMVVTVWHPDADEATIREAIGSRPLLVIEAGTVEEALVQWQTK